MLISKRFFYDKANCWGSKVILLGKVNKCIYPERFLSFDNIWLDGGEKLPNHNRKQCIERCRLDTLCFAINARASLTDCYLFRKTAASTANFAIQKFLKPTTDSKLDIFLDVLIRLDYAFKLVNIRVESGLMTRAILQVQTDTECMMKCKEHGSLCSIFTYIMDATATMKNCFLYSRKTVLCESRKCFHLEYQENYVTQFNMY